MRLIKIALASATLAPLASYAALGAAPAANASPAAQLRVAQSLATATTSASAPYTVHETHGADGVTIREYTTANNIVFAVTWQGPVRPDMSALLGSYFPNYLSAGEGHGRGTGRLIERNGDMQIESAGRPGYVFGRASLPRLVPASVNVGELQ